MYFALNARCIKTHISGVIGKPGRKNEKISCKCRDDVGFGYVWHCGCGADARGDYGSIKNTSNDVGSSKAWVGLTANDSLRIDFWLDSGIVPIAHYYEPQDDHLFKSSKYLSAGPSAIAVKATINGISRQVTSTLSWNLHDYFLVGSNPDHFTFGVSESNAGDDVRNATADLSFANGSTPVLRELLMGHALTTAPLGGSGQFIYRGLVNGKTYDSRVYYSANSLSVSPVPEPETWAMMLLGLGVVGYAARRRAAH